jgi:hypothetical protein
MITYGNGGSFMVYFYLCHMLTSLNICFYKLDISKFTNQNPDCFYFLELLNLSKLNEDNLVRIAAIYEIWDNEGSDRIGLIK